MKVVRIGLTGGIGSGKSTVSRFWSIHSGLDLIDIDHLCRKLLDVDNPGWVAIREEFGGKFFGPDGSLDRAKLRAAIFSDSQLRRQVNRLIHPLALDLLKTKTRSLKQSVLVEVPLLFEAGWQEYFNSVVVVYADRQTCCRRLVSRDRITGEEALGALASQMGIWDKAMSADHVIDNRYGWLYSRQQVVRLAKLYSRKKEC